MFVKVSERKEHTLGKRKEQHVAKEANDFQKKKLKPIHLRKGN